MSQAICVSQTNSRGRIGRRGGRGRRNVAKIVVVPEDARRRRDELARRVSDLAEIARLREEVARLERELDSRTEGLQACELRCETQRNDVGKFFLVTAAVAVTLVEQQLQNVVLSGIESAASGGGLQSLAGSVSPLIALGGVMYASEKFRKM